MTAPRVVGIDPSLTATGIAGVGNLTFTVHGVGDGRLLALHNAVTVAVAGGVDLVMVEDLPTHAQGAGKTGMAQGVVRLALLQADATYVTVTAATLKTFATGKGNATKPDMRVAWLTRTGGDVRDDNQVDALWLRELGCHLLGFPTLQLPKTHTRALAKVPWRAPELVPS